MKRAFALHSYTGSQATRQTRYRAVDFSAVIKQRPLQSVFPAGECDTTHKDWNEEKQKHFQYRETVVISNDPLS